MLTVRDGVSLIRHRAAAPSRLRSRRRSSAPVNSSGLQTGRPGGLRRCAGESSTNTVAAGSSR